MELKILVASSLEEAKLDGIRMEIKIQKWDWWVEQWMVDDYFLFPFLQ